MIDIFGLVSFGNNNSKNISDAATKAPFSHDLRKRVIKGSFYIIHCYFRDNENIESSVFEDSEHLVMVLGRPLMRKDFREMDSIDFDRMGYCVSNLYGNFGTEIIKMLKGLFNIIIFKKADLSLTIISDHFNLFPIFYYYDKIKFVFSTMQKAVAISTGNEKSINKGAIIETILFNYTIGNKTYFRNVFMQKAASILEVDSRKLREKTYWHLSDELGLIKYTKEYGLNEGSDILLNRIQQSVESNSQVASTLTGGYDSRLILSMLLHQGITPVCFSYGYSESLDVLIPFKIMKEIGVNYIPLYLDDKSFLENMSKLAMKAIHQSNGFASFLNAHSLYGYMTYPKYARYVIMGMFGSEILKPIAYIASIYTNYLKKLFVGNNFEKTFFIESASPILSNFNFGDHKALLEEIHSEIYSGYISPYKERFSNRIILYNFIFSESLRKYYMKELHLSKYYLDVLLPYLDIDFIQVIYNSPLAGIYNGSFANILKRMHTNTFYNYCINKFYPRLAEIETHKGIKPIHENKIATMPIAALQFLIAKWKKRVKPQTDDYNFDDCSRFFINDNSRYVKDIMVNGNIQAIDLERLCRLTSLYIYLFEEEKIGL